MITFQKRLIIFFTFLLLLFCISCSKDNSSEKINTFDQNYLIITNNWGISAVDYEESNIDSITVGVIDTANYYNSPNINNISICQQSSNDTVQHGSFVVANLCALLPNTKIISINIADENGAISPDSICEGIECAIRLHCKIINMSLGTQYNYPEIEAMVERAVDSGCIIVAAAGNENNNALDYPANYDNVISVIARNINNIDDYSNNISFQKKSFSAPGSIVFNDLYVVSGSSIATTFVTAEVANIIHVCPDISCYEIIEVLQDSSIFSTDYSHGMVNHKLIMEHVTH